MPDIIVLGSDDEETNVNDENDSTDSEMEALSSIL